MSALLELKNFLYAYHDEVMGLEKKALAAIQEGNADLYRSFMKQKAEKLAALQGEAEPYLARLDKEEREPLFHALHRFSNSARMGLKLDSPFYWSALLWNDDAKAGDPDNLQIFIDSIAVSGKED